MATTITIETGALTVTRTYLNETKSQDTMRRAAQALGAPESATNKQKVNVLLDTFENMIKTAAHSQYVSETATTEIGLE